MAKRSVQSLVQDILKEEGPLTFEELLARVIALQPTTSGNPKQTVRNAVVANRLTQHTEDGRYVYLPDYMRGSSMRVPMEASDLANSLLTAGIEVYTFLWPQPWNSGSRPATLVLDQGPDIVFDRMPYGLVQSLLLSFPVPERFWQWWSSQRTGGADALILRCVDGELGRYAAVGTRLSEVDGAAVAARNAELREAAASIVKPTRGVRGDDLAIRLLARGIYHREPAPDPLDTALFAAGGPFLIEHGMITYRPEITPAMHRLFSERIGEERLTNDPYIDRLAGVQPGPELKLLVPDHTSEIVSAPTCGFRLKVRLAWVKDVWRVVEMLDNQTLEDLHAAIQTAFGWDNDHLYAFFLSGMLWDRMTEVASPLMSEEDEPPFTDEVTLAEIELRPGQHFLYLFDFGDELVHDIEVLEIFPLPTSGTFPRIVKRHGKAPPQYEMEDE